MNGKGSSEKIATVVQVDSESKYCKLEMDGRQIHSYYTRCCWWGMLNGSSEQWVLRGAQVGDRFEVTHIYAGYYGVLRAAKGA